MRIGTTRACGPRGLQLPVRGGRGFTLVEVLIALLLSLFLVHAALDALWRLDAARKRISARTDALVALRVSRHVLRRETRHGIEGTDWVAGGDSLSIRAFRGAAVVCGPDPASTDIVVSYRGDRAPDPTKDSVLLVSAAGARTVRALVGTAAASTPCAVLDSAGAAVWRLEVPPPRDVVAAKLFERGSYHMSGAALRYRRGPGGRQPLTPEVLAATSGWAELGGWLRLELVPADTLGGAPWRGLVATP
jgi:prepilin-type N-terminal cleavage/methylation domain-containing protein